MWGAPHYIYLTYAGCQATKWIGGWLLLMVGQFVHWKLLKRECILSLLEKKFEDPSYVMGSDPSRSFMWRTINSIFFTSFTDDQWKIFHFYFTKMNIMLSIGFLTFGNACFEGNKAVKAISFVVFYQAMNAYLEGQRKLK